MVDEQREEARIRATYEQRKGLPQSRLYTALLPSALFAVQTRERTLLHLLRQHVHKPLSECRLLDVGCGAGGELSRLLPYGFSPDRLYGIDLIEERVERARRQNPRFEVVLGGASHLPWDDGFFDVVIQFTVFSSILDREVRRHVASEMVRVLAPGGIIVSYDMRITRPDNPDVTPIRKAELRELFSGLPICFRTTTLAPPLARRIANWSWILCELLYLLPPLRTHYLAVVQKPGGATG
ncbi:MAG: class I SAM-dependent methyltransferase [Phycisphaerae bacterium]|jgi:SAM-dependent methyltransferase